MPNTHPFTRELWGYAWCFAHNGQLDPVLFNWPLRHFKPIGNTDSEYAFCWLLDQIHQRFEQRPEDPAALAEVIHQCCEQLRGIGVYNMLLSESTRLFSYCTTKLWWITRRAPFGEARLRDRDLTVDFYRETTPDDVVTVVATEPLTANEQWQRIAPGELVVFHDGEVESRLVSASYNFV